MAPAAITQIFISLLVLITRIRQNSSGAVSPRLCSLCNCKLDGILGCESRNITTIPLFAGKMNFSLIFYHNNSIKSIQQFPKLGEVRELVLRENEIAEIEDAAFKNLVNLVVLDLSYNKLNSEELQPRVFRGSDSTDLYEPLRKLMTLNIAYNNLHTLNPNLFEHLPHLQHLYLDGNPLNVIGNGVLGAISRIPILNELNLANTRLTSLPDNCFHDIKFLKTLDLSDNLFTVPPEPLQSSHRLEWLSLNGNPLTRIRYFPKLHFLQTLHLSRMPQLISIENRSLSGLPRLEAFYCSNNPNLVQIDKNVFSYVNETIGEGEIWPPLTTLVLRNNALRYIESHLVGRWDYLRHIDLQGNPWLCDCENQWMLSILVPLIMEAENESLQDFKCGLPSEMENKSLIDMFNSNYEMRCLDRYNHKPEKDGKLLIQIIIFVIIIAPLLMGTVLYYKRYVKISKLHKLNLFIRYSQLDLVPVIKKTETNNKTKSLEKVWSTGKCVGSTIYSNTTNALSVNKLFIKLITTKNEILDNTRDDRT